MNRARSSPPVDVKEFLRPLLFGVMEEDLDELARAAEVRTVRAGETIFREGDPGDAVYAVMQGAVEIIKELEDGTERHLHEARQGEFFGEMAILQEGGRNATVRASSPAAVLEIDRDPFLNVLGRSPALSIRFMVRLTNRLRDSDLQAIAELREANEELTRALERLEKIDRTKTDFIRLSAHELRTPVAALLGYAQMMQTNPAARDHPELRALVEGVVAGTERLHRIFNSILDLSRVMTEGLEVRRSPVSIPVTFHSIRSEFEPALEERGLTLDLVGLDTLPLCTADPDLVYKTFRHLVNNAIKYTPDGGHIRVVGRTVDVAELGRCIEVVVEDNGIGIEPDDLDPIFETFYRKGEVALHSSGVTSFKGGGPGLGLAIARGATLAHGGRIWAESPGYDEEACPGSRFVVQLPLRE